MVCILWSSIVGHWVAGGYFLSPQSLWVEKLRVGHQKTLHALLFVHVGRGRSVGLAVHSCGIARIRTGLIGLLAGWRRAAAIRTVRQIACIFRITIFASYFSDDWGSALDANTCIVGDHIPAWRTLYKCHNWFLLKIYVIPMCKNSVFLWKVEVKEPLIFKKLRFFGCFL